MEVPTTRSPQSAKIRRANFSRYLSTPELMMATVLAKAAHDRTPTDLADLHCVDARRRVAALRRELRDDGRPRDLVDRLHARAPDVLHDVVLPT